MIIFFGDTTENLEQFLAQIDLFLLLNTDKLRGEDKVVSDATKVMVLKAHLTGSALDAMTPFIGDGRATWKTIKEKLVSWNLKKSSVRDSFKAIIAVQPQSFSSLESFACKLSELAKQIAPNDHEALACQRFIDASPSSQAIHLRQFMLDGKKTLVEVVQRSRELGFNCDQSATVAQYISKVDE